MIKIEKMYILLFCLIVLSMSYAQDIKGFTDKGNVLVAGTISFTSNFGELYSVVPYDTGKIIIIEAKPNMLYFVVKNLALGGEFSIAHQYIEELEMSATQIGIGPKIAYFTKLGSAYTFLGAKLEYLNNTVVNEVNDGLGIGLSGGILAPLTGNTGVLIEAGYRWEAIFFEPKAQTGGTIFLGVGVGGVITTNRR